jgi:hypothetical protein
MSAFQYWVGFIYRWVMPVVLSGAALLGSLRLFWQEWLMLEALVGFGIAFFNFIWIQMLFFEDPRGFVR